MSLACDLPDENPYDPGTIEHAIYRLRRDNERLRTALLFIHDECDWEPGYANGGDGRIGKACTDALSPNAGCEGTQRKGSE